MDDTEARGIIAAVFQPAEAFENDVLGGFLADVADDATHAARSLSEVAQRRFNRPDISRVIGGDGESQWRGLRIALCFFTADSG